MPKTARTYGSKGTEQKRLKEVPRFSPSVEAKKADSPKSNRESDIWETFDQSLSKVSPIGKRRAYKASSLQSEDNDETSSSQLESFGSLRTDLASKMRGVDRLNSSSQDTLFTATDATFENSINSSISNTDSMRAAIPAASITYGSSENDTAMDEDSTQPDEGLSAGNNTWQGPSFNSSIRARSKAKKTYSVGRLSFREFNDNEASIRSNSCKGSSEGKDPSNSNNGGAKSVYANGYKSDSDDDVADVYNNNTGSGNQIAAGSELKMQGERTRFLAGVKFLFDGLKTSSKSARHSSLVELAGRTQQTGFVRQFRVTEYFAELLENMKDTELDGVSRFLYGVILSEILNDSRRVGESNAYMTLNLIDVLVDMLKDTRDIREICKTKEANVTVASQRMINDMIKKVFASIRMSTIPIDDEYNYSCDISPCFVGLTILMELDKIGTSQKVVGMLHERLSPYLDTFLDLADNLYEKILTEQDKPASTTREIPYKTLNLLYLVLTQLEFICQAQVIENSNVLKRAINFVMRALDAMDEGGDFAASTEMTSGTTSTEASKSMTASAESRSFRQVAVASLKWLILLANTGVGHSTIECMYDDKFIQKIIDETLEYLESADQSSDNDIYLLTIGLLVSLSEEPRVCDILLSERNFARLMKLTNNPQQPSSMIGYLFLILGLLTVYKKDKFTDTELSQVKHGLETFKDGAGVVGERLQSQLSMVLSVM